MSATDTPTVIEARPPQYIGARVRRVEDPRFLTGRARYLDDITVPGTLHATFVRSPHPHARILSIDTSAAAGLDGVVAVFTGEEMAGLVKPYVADIQREEVQAVTTVPLPTDKVRYVGEAVAVVVATSRYVAEDGRDLVDIEWEPLPAVVDPEKAMEPDAPRLHDHLERNNVAHIVGGAGDVDAAFERADHVVSKRFHHGRVTAASVEPRGLLADPEPHTGAMTLWASTQMPHLMRTFLAPQLGLSESKLTVRAPEVGGGFGLKCHMFVEDVVIPAVASALGRPVKWVEDRYENLACGVHSKELVAEMDLALSADGDFLGMRARFVGDSGAYSSVPYTPLIDALSAATILPAIYKVRDVSYVVDVPTTNKCQIGAVRGVGWTTGQTLRESLIDDAARVLGKDPLELRKRNCIPSEPYVSALGARYDGGSYVESMDRAAEMLDYQALRARQTELRAQGRYIGIGFSPFIEPTGLGSRGAQISGFPISYHDMASVTVEPDGSVTVNTGLHSHGQGHETTLAQVAADEVGVRLEDVTIRFASSDGDAWGMGTYASRSAVIGTGTIAYAARDVRARLIEVAATLLEAAPEDISIVQGMASVVGVPNNAVPLSAIAGFSYFAGAVRPQSIQEQGLTSTRAYDPEETYSNGTFAAVVEVDVETGEVKIERFVAVEDCGVMLNPTIVEGQLAGAAACGIGGALLEELVYDDDGQFLSGSLMDYLYPSSTDIPSFEIAHIETPSAVSVNGVKGMGEGGTIATPAAIVNAVADALAPFDVTIEQVPMTPTYVLELIERARAGSGSGGGAVRY